MDYKNQDFKAQIAAIFEKIQSFFEQLLEKIKPSSAKKTGARSPEMPFSSEGAQAKATVSKTTPSQPGQSRYTFIKGTIGIIVLVIIIILWRSFSHFTDARKATQYVIQQVQNKPVLAEILGTGIHASETGAGHIQIPGFTGQMTILVAGSKSTGKLNATLNRGNITSLILTKANGETVDVLQMDKLIMEDVQKKAAQAKLENDFNQAVIAMQTHQFGDAITGFDNAISHNYRVPDAYEYLGLIYTQQANYEKCIDNFNAYLGLRPDDAQAYYQMAYCYLQRYDKPSALFYLSKSCSLGNQNACAAAQQIEKSQSALETTIQQANQPLTGEISSQNALAPGLNPSINPGGVSNQPSAMSQPQPKANNNANVAMPVLPAQNQQSAAPNTSNATPTATTTPATGAPATTNNMPAPNPTTPTGNNTTSSNNSAATSSSSATNNNVATAPVSTAGGTNDGSAIFASPMPIANVGAAPVSSMAGTASNSNASPAQPAASTSPAANSNPVASQTAPNTMSTGTSNTIYGGQTPANTAPTTSNNTAPTQATPSTTAAPSSNAAPAQATPATTPASNNNAAPNQTTSTTIYGASADNTNSSFSASAATSNDGNSTTMPALGTSMQDTADTASLPQTNLFSP